MDCRLLFPLQGIVNMLVTVVDDVCTQKKWGALTSVYTAVLEVHWAFEF